MACMVADSALIEQLRAAIRAHGIRRTAREAGVDPSQLTRFLRGERDLTLTTAARIISALGLELRPKKLSVQ